MPTIEDNGNQIEVDDDCSCINASCHEHEALALSLTECKGGKFKIPNNHWKHIKYPNGGYCEFGDTPVASNDSLRLEAGLNQTFVFASGRGNGRRR